MIDPCQNTDLIKYGKFPLPKLHLFYPCKITLIAPVKMRIFACVNISTMVLKFSQSTVANVVKIKISFPRDKTVVRGKAIRYMTTRK